MRILIITTYYPPDTAIAAIRPYMLGKYLKKLGHEITVLRSGLLQQSADHSFSGHEGIRVITYLGKNSPAERFEEGTEVLVDAASNAGKSRIAFLPERIRKLIAKLYHTLAAPYDFYKWVQGYKKNRFEPMKKAIDDLYGERFDVVFSTYGDIENIWGGQYAAEKLGCKWILDYRDPLTAHAISAFARPFLNRIQRDSILKADICTTVSDDLAESLSCQAGGKTVHTLYNGYEPNATNATDVAPLKGALSFCYTGAIYGGRSFAPLLEALRKLSEDGKISLDKVCFHYAGKDFEFLRQQAERYHVTDILVNHGYVNRNEAARIQAESDYFVVSSWNTKKEKGVLTGKFYEGIRSVKPILAIVTGQVAYSELDRINKKYQYGFCYEECRKNELFGKLCDYLENAYQEKMQFGAVRYAPDPALVTDFRYDTLSKKLESLCLQLITEKEG